MKLKLDKRKKTTKIINRWFNKYTASAAMWGLIIGSLFGCYLASRPKQALSSPLGQKIEFKVEKVIAQETPFCYDPITCIRDVGEELGESNEHIMQMIRIARKESNFRSEALNINTNKTVDRGIFQINSIHKGLSNADAFNFEKNIRYAYKIHITQGHKFSAWVVYNNGSAK